MVGTYPKEAAWKYLARHLLNFLAHPLLALLNRTVCVSLVSEGLRYLSKTLVLLELLVQSPNK